MYGILTFLVSSEGARVEKEFGGWCAGEEPVYHRDLERLAAGGLIVREGENTGSGDLGGRDMIWFHHHPQFKPSDFCGLTENEAYRLPGFGRKSMRHLRQELERLGLTLGMDRLVPDELRAMVRPPRQPPPKARWTREELQAAFQARYDRLTQRYEGSTLDIMAELLDFADKLGIEIKEVE
jgi:hypothetical protein